MLCPNCGASVPAGLEKCLSCGSRVHASEVDDPYEYDGYRSSSEIPEKTGSSGNKGISIFLGCVEIGIGLFATVVMFVMLTSMEIGLALVMTPIYFMFAVIMPLAGVILIGVGKYRIGAILLIIGSVPCLPIGIIGGIGGRLALTIND